MTGLCSAVTENTRASYPIEYIDNARIPCVGPHPKNLILLCCDAFGVLPPVSRLTREQAMYHFISGYTAKVRCAQSTWHHARLIGSTVAEEMLCRVFFWSVWWNMSSGCSRFRVQVPLVASIEAKSVMTGCNAQQVLSEHGDC